MKKCDGSLVVFFLRSFCRAGLEGPAESRSVSPIR